MSSNRRSGSHRPDGYEPAGGETPAGGGHGTERGGYGYGYAPGGGGGEYDPAAGEHRTVIGGYPLPGREYGSAPGGDYGTPGGEYGSSGRYGVGSGYAYSSGEYGTGSGTYSNGGYGTGSGEYGTGSGAYSSGAYGAGSGEQRGGAYGSGGYGAGGREYGSGEYGSRSGQDPGSEYRSGEYGRRPHPRRSAGSGGYRSGTGSHRVVRETRPGRRFTLVLVGVAAGISACALAVFAVLNGVGVGEDDKTGQVVGRGAAENSPTSKAERTAVPDACEVLPQQVADRLAPGADRTPADNYDSNDRQNQCVWGAYTGDNKRQLTVELRAIEGAQSKTPTAVARERFAAERKEDESGKALLPGQELTEKSSLDDVADEGYLVYSVDEGQGSGAAIANVRMVNVLVTVHYSGGDDGEPLASSHAMDGATEAVRSVVEALNAG